MPITWRNVEMGNSGSANNLLVNGTEGVMSGLNKLTNLAEDQRALNMRNYDTVAKNNTTDALAKLNEIRTSDALMKEANGGVLDTTKLDAALGKQYNKGAVSDAVTGKLTSLLTAEKTAAVNAKMETERLQDREVSLRRAATNEQRGNQMHQIAMQDHQMKMAQQRASLEFDNLASQIITNSPDKDVANSQISKLAMEYNKSGRLPAETIFTKERVFKDRINGVGLDSVAAAESQFEKTAALKESDAVAKRTQTLLTEHRKINGFDPEFESMAKDTSLTPGQAMIEVSNDLKDKGAVNTTALALRREEIENAFVAEGLPLPSGRVLKEILTQGGHDDKWFGMDAEYELNRDVVNKFVSKAKKNHNYTETQLPKEMAILQLQAQATNDINTLLTNNDSERSREAYAKNFTNQMYKAAPLDINAVKTAYDASFKQLENELAAARKNMKPEAVAPKKSKDISIMDAAALTNPIGAAVLINRLSD